MSNDYDYILKLENIDKSFSTVKVLDKVELFLKRGEVLGLVGENGAGKSTLMNILGGVLKSDSGEIYFDGQKYQPNNPLEAQELGIAFIHQELNLFGNLSIVENMFIEKLPVTGVLKTINYKYMREETKKYLQMLGIDLSPNNIIDSLSMGQRQMVEIAKAVSKNAKVIIFDEPTTSLSNKEKENLFRVINELKDRGTSIIYISHILEDVFKLCDRIQIIRDGKVTGTGTIDSLTEKEVIKLMVGRELNQQFPTIQKEIGEVIYKAENINQQNKMKNVSFSLRKGEIVGLFGLMGAGRTELASALFGVDKFDSGEIYFEGKKLYPVTPINCINRGIAYITENRREQGLFMSKNIKANLVAAYLPDLTGKLKVVDRKKENEVSDKVIHDVNIKTYDKNQQLAQQLSGGNQQKVVLGKWFLKNPKVFMLDEPTRGVDVGAKYEIYNIINNLAKNGSTILFISSEMEELMGMCDRIMVMCKGEITGEVIKGHYVQEEILKAAIGGGI